MVRVSGILQMIKFEYVTRGNAYVKANQYLRHHEQTARALASRVAGNTVNLPEFPRPVIEKAKGLLSSLPERLSTREYWENLAEKNVDGLPGLAGEAIRTFRRALARSPEEIAFWCLTTRPVDFAYLIAEARGERIFSDDIARVVTNKSVESLIETELPKLEILLKGFCEKDTEEILKEIFDNSIPFFKADHNNPAYHQFVKEVAGEFLRLGKDFISWLHREGKMFEDNPDGPYYHIPAFVYAFREKIMDGDSSRHNQILARYYASEN